MPSGVNDLVKKLGNKSELKNADYLHFKEFRVSRFVFMALMEYCLVNIVLGDSDLPQKPPEPPKSDKIFELAAKVGNGNVNQWGLLVSAES